MKTKICALTISFLILTFVSCKKSDSPVTTISGKVTDASTNAGIAANIILNPGNLSQIAGSDGRYEFKVADITKTYSITTTFPNYKDVTKTDIAVNYGQKTTIDIPLTLLNPRLTFTEPLQGISWHIETQQTISWTSSDLVGNIKLELIKGGAITQNIAASIENNGSYQWTLPNSLSAGADYKIRISSVTNTSLTFESDNFSIATLPAPTAVTQSATNLGSTSATLNALVNANGQSTTIAFEYGKTTSYGSSATPSQSPATGTTNTSVSKDIAGLTSSTVYHFRVKAVSEGGTIYGEDITFTTSAPTYESINEKERNGPSTTLTTVNWSYYRDYSTSNKTYFIINGGYTGAYAGYNAASYKNYDWDLFDLAIDKNDEVTVEVLQGTTSGLWGMSLSITLDMVGGTSVGTKPTISGSTYKWTIICNANESVSDAYLMVSMPNDLINTGPYNYQLKVTINKK
jgi:hypothetical protein